MGDHRKYNTTYSLEDLLSADFAIFSLKDPSLLAFWEQYPQRSENLKRIYRIERIPEDTALRQGLDGIDPACLQTQFKPLIERLREEGSTERKNRFPLALEPIIRQNGKQKNDCELNAAKCHQSPKMYPMLSAQTTTA